MAGFKDFLMRGNLIDLAIAFILGAAFGDVVKAFTQIVMDIIGLLGGQPDFTQVAVGGVNIGVFITAIVSFVILSAILYFGVVKPYELVKSRGKQPTDGGPVPPSSEELLTEIRDLLKSQAK